jgi:hypothetical protein
MMIEQINELDDGGVLCTLHMTPEEHRQLLESAVIHAMHLMIQEQKDIEKEYENE